MNKSKTIVHNQKHLTLSDRTFIDQELCQGSFFKYIGDTLHKNPTTISKEVRNHRKPIDAKAVAGSCKDCIFRDDCKIKGSDKDASACPRSDYCTS